MAPWESGQPWEPCGQRLGAAGRASARPAVPGVGLALQGLAQPVELLAWHPRPCLQLCQLPTQVLCRGSLPVPWERGWEPMLGVSQICRELGQQAVEGQRAQARAEGLGDVGHGMSPGRLPGGGLEFPPPGARARPPCPAPSDRSAGWLWRGRGGSDFLGGLHGLSLPPGFRGEAKCGESWGHPRSSRPLGLLLLFLQARLAGGEGGTGRSPHHSTFSPVSSKEGARRWGARVEGPRLARACLCCTPPPGARTPPVPPPAPLPH